MRVWVLRQNLTHYDRLLAEAPSPDQRAMLEQLRAEALRELAALEARPPRA